MKHTKEILSAALFVGIMYGIMYGSCVLLVYMAR